MKTCISTAFTKNIEHTGFNQNCQTTCRQFWDLLMDLCFPSVIFVCWPIQIPKVFMTCKISQSSWKYEYKLMGLGRGGIKGLKRRWKDGGVAFKGRQSANITRSSRLFQTISEIYIMRCGDDKKAMWLFSYFGLRPLNWMVTVLTVVMRETDPVQTKRERIFGYLSFFFKTT